MATDIFNREQLTVGGVFASDKAVMTISGGNSLGKGALVQDVNVTYNQPITQLYELGSNNVYPLAGRASGTVTVQKIVSDKSFDKALFDACENGATVVFSGLNGTCGNGGGGSGNINVTCRGVIVTTWGMTMNTQDPVVRENFQAITTCVSRE